MRTCGPTTNPNAYPTRFYIGDVGVQTAIVEGLFNFSGSLTARVTCLHCIDDRLTPCSNQKGNTWQMDL